MATTAGLLLAYRKELQQGRMHPDTIDELTKIASQQLIANEGLRVRTEQIPPPGVPSKALPPEQA
ncbi:hypothetical protein AB0G29_12645 [Streptomyces parvus]|uniref:hypothetical protein n=1 Tax=Streptomyces parvus TaxID=66428 RepID=UPI0033E71753